MKTRALWGMMAVAGFVLTAFVMTVAPTSVRAQAPPSSCGNAIVEPGEECDPPTSPCVTSPGGAFGTCDAACQCIENTTTTIAVTTTTIAVTTTVTTTSSTATTLPSSCGNAIIDPGEQCDPPTSPCLTSPGGAFGTCSATCQCDPNTTTTAPSTTLPTTTSVTSTSSTLATTTSTLATTTTVATTSTTTTTVCSPTPENTSPACGDMIDNDCDGAIDCVDSDCFGIFPCPPAAKDPTTITFGHAGRLDRIHGHAKLTMATVDLKTLPVNMLLTGPGGSIYSDGLLAGDLAENSKGNVFQYRNAAARTTGGIADLKIKKNKDGATYTFSFTSYGDLSGANDSHMRLQFYIGNDPNAASDGRVFVTREAPWKQTGNGWRAPKDH